MMAEKKRAVLIVFLAAYPFFLYFVILLVPHVGESLAVTISELEIEMESGNDFLIPRYTDNTVKACAVFTVVYFIISSAVISSIRNYRTDEEYGSAKWGSVTSLNRFLSNHTREGIRKLNEMNLRLTRNVSIGFDYFRHQLNLNVLIFGGSGARKTRGFIIPNLMMHNSSFVVTDPKGEILTKAGKLLKLFGYDIRVLDLKNPEKSFGYNPFVYFKDDKDVLSFVNQTWEAMGDKTATKGESIWDDQAKNMLLSFMLYLFHYAPYEEQNFATVIEMMNEVKSGEDSKQPQSAVDMLFEKIPYTDPAYGFYKAWSAARGRTLASIVTTLSARLAVFNLDTLKKLTSVDELNLTELGVKKTALFIVTPDSDKSLNFLAGTLYSQLFRQLFDYADNVCRGELPVHVTFLMDEFANIALPDDYEKILSTVRSRNISFCIVLQNKAQIEALFEKVYKSLIGNCDSFLFLGSNEYDTCKYFSDLMDDETVIVRTYNKTYGLRGSVTRNETKTARKLMTPGELRKLSNRKAVLIVRGQDPVIDYKIDMKRCDNYRLLADGRRFRKNMYEWGTTERSIGELELLTGRYGGEIVPLPETKAELLDDSSLRQIFYK